MMSVTDGEPRSPEERTEIARMIVEAEREQRRLTPDEAAELATIVFAEHLERMERAIRRSA